MYLLLLFRPVYRPRGGLLSLANKAIGFSHKRRPVRELSNAPTCGISPIAYDADSKSTVPQNPLDFLPSIDNNATRRDGQNKVSSAYGDICRYNPDTGDTCPEIREPSFTRRNDNAVKVYATDRPERVECERARARQKKPGRPSCWARAPLPLPP